MVKRVKCEYLSNYNETACYGCGACVHFCPTKAISMIKNDRGFLYPEFQEEKCINCGLCRKVCPNHIVHNGRRGVIFQAYHVSREVLLESQSGGVFTALSDCFLEDGGAVYGCVLNDVFEAEHVRAIAKEERDRMRGSKYVQSTIGGVEDMLAYDVKSGIPVLFVGTPCQSAMVKENYDAENLYVVDFLCHGVPSPALWKRYIMAKEKIYNIKKVKFRNKICEGKGNHTESIYDQEGNEHISNTYAAIYYSHLAHRPSCFQCRFAGQERYSDITIGGYLDKSNFEAPLDSSMVIVNTEKGRKLFDRAKRALRYQHSCLAEYKQQPCYYHPVLKPGRYDEFWNDYLNMDILDLMKKYASEEIKHRFHIEIPTDCKNIDEV